MGCFFPQKSAIPESLKGCPPGIPNPAARWPSLCRLSPLLPAAPCPGGGTRPPACAPPFTQLQPPHPDGDCPSRHQHQLGQLWETGSYWEAAVGTASHPPSPRQGCEAHSLGIRRRVLTWDPNLTQTSAMYNGSKAISLLQGSSPVVCISHKVVGACD